MDFPKRYPNLRGPEVQVPSGVYNSLELMEGDQFFDRPVPTHKVDKGIIAMIRKYVPDDHMFSASSVYAPEALARFDSMGVSVHTKFQGQPMTGVKEALEAFRKKEAEELAAKVQAEIDAKKEADVKVEEIEKIEKDLPRIGNPRTEDSADFSILDDHPLDYDVKIMVPPLTDRPVAAITQFGEAERCKKISIKDQKFRTILPVPVEFAKMVPFFPMRGEAHINSSGNTDNVTLRLYDRHAEIRSVTVCRGDLHISDDFRTFLLMAERHGMEVCSFRNDALALLTTAVLQNYDFDWKDGRMLLVRSRRFGTFFGAEYKRIREYMIHLPGYFAKMVYSAQPDTGAEIFRACLSMRVDMELVLDLYSAREQCMRHHLDAEEAIVLDPNVCWGQDILAVARTVPGYVNALGRIKPPAAAFIPYTVTDYLNLIRLATYLRVPIYHTSNPSVGVAIIAGATFKKDGEYQRPNLDVVSLGQFAHLRAIYFCVGGLSGRSRLDTAIHNYRFNVVTGEYVRLNFIRTTLMGAQRVTLTRSPVWGIVVREVYSVVPDLRKGEEPDNGDVIQRVGTTRVVNGFGLQALGYAQMVCGYLNGAVPPDAWSFYTSIKSEWRPVYMPLLVPAPSDFVSRPLYGVPNDVERQPNLEVNFRAHLMIVSQPPMPVIASLAYTLN